MWYAFALPSGVAWIIEADDKTGAEAIGYENGMDTPLYDYRVNLGITNYSSICGDPYTVASQWKKKYGKYAQGEPSTQASSSPPHRVYAIGKVKFKTIEDYACCKTAGKGFNEFDAVEVIYKNGNIRRFCNGREEMAIIRTYHDNGIDTTAWETLLMGEQG